MTLQKLLEKTRVSVTAFAALVGVARPTASRWANGHQGVSRHVVGRYDDVTSRMARALKEGKLPLDKRDAAGIGDLKKLRTVLR